MKIHLLSDLHLEEESSFTPPETDADVVVLAGDIDTGIAGVEWALDSFDKPVVYTFGNHEGWGFNLDTLIGQARALTHGTHVHILENESRVIGDTAFIGAIFWTDFGLADDPQELMEISESRKNDFKLIQVGDASRALRAADVVSRHQHSRAYIHHAARAHKARKTAVVTHFAPSERSIVARRQGHRFAPSYAADAHALMGKPIDVWMHGHLHDSVDFDVSGTRVVANPRGGIAEISRNPDFIADLIVEI
jgi:predicted phosphodiesterase